MTANEPKSAGYAATVSSDMQSRKDRFRDRFDAVTAKMGSFQPEAHTAREIAFADTSASAKLSDSLRLKVDSVAGNLKDMMAAFAKPEMPKLVVAEAESAASVAHSPGAPKAPAQLS